jgi:prepilin-type N-terminal cleavage/methylation domain-containing protein
VEVGKLNLEARNQASPPQGEISMKLDLQAKFLQHLNKKKQDQGFTLIELLVVIIIIGILAAIALPSFLSQANKGKQSEAKTYVGTLNKGQQAYYTENSDFSDTISDLGVGINTSTVNYKYTTDGTTATTIAGNFAISKAKSNFAALKGYAGRVELYPSGTTSEATSVAILCEQKTPAKDTADDPTSGTKCADAQNQVK